MQLLQGDCLELMKEIPDGSVDMVLCDLPYGITDHPWDKPLPLDKLWKEYRRVCKQTANVLLFCKQPFTTQIMNSTPCNWFSQSLIWEKNNATHGLSAKTNAMSSYEEILVFRINKFSNKGRHVALRDYFINELNKSGMTVQQIKAAIPNYAAHHFFTYLSDFRIPTEKSYKRLQEITGLFQRDYAEIRKEFDDERRNLCTYNTPQNNRDVLKFDVPSSQERFHPTQKPVPLLEHLIKAYTNEGETVLDNCMGSGSTGVACVNTGRDFIGIELDEHYFQVAKERIEKAIAEKKQAASIDTNTVPA